MASLSNKKVPPLLVDPRRDEFDEDDNEDDEEADEFDEDDERSEDDSADSGTDSEPCSSTLMAASKK